MNESRLLAIIQDAVRRELAAANGDEFPPTPASGQPAVAESRDILLQVRVTPSEKAAIDQVVKFRQASGEPSYCVSDFLREATSLLCAFYPFVDLLRSERDFLVSMLKRLAQRR